MTNNVKQYMLKLIVLFVFFSDQAARFQGELLVLSENFYLVMLTKILPSPICYLQLNSGLAVKQKL